MNSIAKQKKHLATGIRWVARIYSGVVVSSLLYCTILLGFKEDGLADSVGQSAPIAMMSFWYFLAVVGMVVGFKWASCGGFMTIGGILAVYITGIVSDGSYPLGYVLPLFLMSGALYLLSWRLDRANRNG